MADGGNDAQCMVYPCSVPVLVYNQELGGYVTVWKRAECCDSWNECFMV